MTTLSAPMSSFDALDDPTSSDLLAAAAAATTHAVADPTAGPLVIIVRPTADDHQVLAGGGNSVLRAAVSVAADSAHDRLWQEAPDGTTARVSVRSLPEVVRAAADASAIEAVHIGCVRIADELACVAIWFETDDADDSQADRQTTMNVLAAAAQRDHERPVAAAPAPTVAEVEAVRRFDPSDPDLHPVTGVANAECFGRRMEEHDTDDATLLLIDLDGLEHIAAEFGTDTFHSTLKTVADRLCNETRRSDVVGHLDGDRFALLFGEVDRASAMAVAKRLLGTIAEPMRIDGLELAITATIAFSHEDGLIDLEEMMESAEDAIASGKRAGGGRLVIAL